MTHAADPAASHRLRSAGAQGDVFGWHELGPAELAEEGRQRRAIGLPSASLDHAALRDLAGIDRRAALLSEGAADLDPVRLTIGLLRRAMANGCRLYSPAELAEVVPTSRKVAMVTTTGIELEARRTGVRDRLRAGRRRALRGTSAHQHVGICHAASTHAIWGHGELIWEASAPYLYIRTTRDGRVIGGGGRRSIE